MSSSLLAVLPDAAVVTLVAPATVTATAIWRPESKSPALEHWPLRTKTMPPMTMRKNSTPKIAIQTQPPTQKRSSTRKTRPTTKAHRPVRTKESMDFSKSPIHVPKVSVEPDANALPPSAVKASAATPPTASLTAAAISNMQKSPAKSENVMPGNGTQYTEGYGQMLGGKAWKVKSVRIVFFIGPAIGLVDAMSFSQGTRRGVSALGL
mmetsp:Transcript_44037/g.99270  ORF Transcript_44037/g.99270 Transcript_44037/m.99270 type:complete len:208 (+) Transcript_44037:706-1329(+)